MGVPKLKLSEVYTTGEEAIRLLIKAKSILASRIARSGTRSAPNFPNFLVEIDNLVRRYAMETRKQARKHKPVLKAERESDFFALLRKIDSTPEVHQPKDQSINHFVGALRELINSVEEIRGPEVRSNLIGPSDSLVTEINRLLLIAGLRLVYEADGREVKIAPGDKFLVFGKDQHFAAFDLVFLDGGVLWMGKIFALNIRQKKALRFLATELYKVDGVEKVTQILSSDVTKHVSKKVQSRSNSLGALFPRTHPLKKLGLIQQGTSAQYVKLKTSA